MFKDNYKKKLIKLYLKLNNDVIAKDINRDKIYFWKLHKYISKEHIMQLISYIILFKNT